MNAIGGIEALRDHLAEDYLLGRMVSRAGYRVVLSGDEIETAEVSRSLSAAWSRQRRWAILRKRLGGPSYAAELLASPLPWFAGVLLAARNEPGLVACAAALYLSRIGLEALDRGAVGKLLRGGLGARSAPGPRGRCALLGGTLRVCGLPGEAGPSGSAATR